MKCKCGCEREVRPGTWPGNEGYDSAICVHLDLLRKEREEFAARMRSPEFLASGLGLVLGKKE